MKRLSTSTALLSLLFSGCGEDPKPIHVDGSYTFGCETGCNGGAWEFRGDDRGGNTLSETGDWAKIYVTCSITSLGGGAKSVTGFVSDQPLSGANDAGRSGFQIDSSVVAGGVTDPYQITLWDPPGDFHVKSADLVEGQAACDLYEVAITGNDSYSVDFDCPDMRTTFELPARYTRTGHIEFSRCH